MYTKRILEAVGIIAVLLCSSCKTKGEDTLAMGSTREDKVSSIEDVIKTAQTLSMDELFSMAAKESNGQTLYCIATSSRGSQVAAPFIEELKKKEPSYNGTIDWYVPGNNTIFGLLIADIQRIYHKYSMTLIQDDTQLQRKLLNTKGLLNFTPKEWREAKGVNVAIDGNPLALQTIIRVFEANSVSTDSYEALSYTNCWDFIYKGQSPLSIGIDSQPAGRNFLYMLTKEEYSRYLEEAYMALDANKKAYFEPVIQSMASQVPQLGLANSNAKYALAYIKLWCSMYKPMDNDPAISSIVTSSTKGVGTTGLLVYSRFRTVKESDTSSVNNVKIVAYEAGYEGIGGYAYKHYLQVVRTAPLPWTACAFIAYMVTRKEGFNPWGKDIGQYSSNPNITIDHSRDGYKDGVNIYPGKNDRGYNWWLSSKGGKLVLEDCAYCATVSAKLSKWLDSNLGL